MDFPICLVKNADGELHVVPGAIKYLMGLNQQVSYLMNKLSGKRKGFALGATIQSKTKGIWIWCVPHPEKRDHTLMLLDTERMGEGERSKFNAWHCMLLLSITLVYNSRGTIDNQAVENLQYVSELTEQIKVNSSSAALSSHDDEEGGDIQFVQFFPNFVWAVRFHSTTRDRRRDSPLNMMYNLPRECIRNYFPSRKCFVFRTTTTPANMPHLDSMDEADLCGSFRTVKGGHIFTGISQISANILHRCIELVILTDLSQGAHHLRSDHLATQGPLFTNVAIANLWGCFLQAEEILEQFRKEKSLEKYSILQADRKMDRKLEKVRNMAWDWKEGNRPGKIYSENNSGCLESTVMPVLRFELDAANTLFQYTLMKVAFMK
uniref:GB1/RHD3-type G domain-containing protein n=1 Tax=Oncorhynchus kisutch TaxID=8019 RepID=A0A8C7I3I0_ONCKI